MDWTKIAGELGVPVMILVALGFAAWRVAKFFAPMIRQGFDRFITMMDHTSDNIQKHTTILGGMNEKLSDHSEKLDSHGLLLNEIKSKVSKAAPPDSTIIK